MNSPLDKIQDFEIKIKSINVKDFGDFRRKANAYIVRLDEDLKPRPSKVESILAEIKMFVNYLPNWQMENTRRKILTFTAQIREELKGEQRQH